jgi:hypothetical protein
MYIHFQLKSMNLSLRDLTRRSAHFYLDISEIHPSTRSRTNLYISPLSKRTVSLPSVLGVPPPKLFSALNEDTCKQMKYHVLFCL